MASRSRRRDLERLLSVMLTIMPPFELLLLFDEEEGGSLLLLLLLFVADLRRLKVEPSGPRPVVLSILEGL